MASGLGSDEQDIIEALVRKGLSREEAVVAVVMAVREHSRPDHELVDILKLYPHLEDRNRNQAAIASLRAKQWLCDRQTYGLTLVHQALDLREKIAAFLGEPEVAHRLAELSALRASYISVLGSMNDDQVYQGFHSRIEGARSEILLPMLATTPNLHAAKLLQERARAGISIRIILASPSVLEKVRGEGLKQEAKDSIAGWKRNAENHPKIQIRVSNRPDDCLAASSMMVDDSILRFDVYDPLRQRSLQGEMFEIHAPDELKLNINQIYRAYFETAWRRSRPTGGRRLAEWWIKELRFWLLALATGGVALYCGATALGGIFGSVAASFVVADVFVRLD